MYELRPKMKQNVTQISKTYLLLQASPYSHHRLSRTNYSYKTSLLIFFKLLFYYFYVLLRPVLFDEMLFEVGYAKRDTSKINQTVIRSVCLHAALQCK